jgi:hypothetical protein
VPGNPKHLSNQHSETGHPASAAVQPPISTIPYKTLNNLIPACYPVPVFAEMDPRRIVPSSNHYPPKSFPLNLFADSHHVTPVASIYYKNMGGEGAPPIFRSLSPDSHGIISFTDPHPLNLLKSYRFKNIGRRGAASADAELHSSDPPIHPLSFLYLTRSFPQRHPVNSFGINSLRTLSVSTGVRVPPRVHLSTSKLALPLVVK